MSCRLAMPGYCDGDAVGHCSPSTLVQNADGGSNNDSNNDTNETHETSEFDFGADLGIHLAAAIGFLIDIPARRVVRRFARARGIPQSAYDRAMVVEEKLRQRKFQLPDQAAFLSCGVSPDGKTSLARLGEVGSSRWQAVATPV